MENSPEPDMALEVLEQTDTREQPVEKALIAEQLFRKTIEESIPCGILGFDMQGKQIYVNRVFCEMVGWPEKDLIGAKFPFKYLPPNHLKNADANFQLLLTGEVPLGGIELPFQRNNGDRFWGFVLSATLTDSKGSMISIPKISRQGRLKKKGHAPTRTCPFLLHPLNICARVFSPWHVTKSEPLIPAHPKSAAETVMMFKPLVHVPELLYLQAPSVMYDPIVSFNRQLALPRLSNCSTTRWRG